MSEIITQWNANQYSSKHAYVFKYGEGLLDVLAPKSDEVILDVGCGTGELTAKIKEKCAEVIGIDSSPSMIHTAQSNFPEVKFQKADAANFSFESTFDAVFSNAALHWVKNYQGAIHCMYHSLKVGGRLVLEMGGKGNIHSIIHQLRTTLAQRGYAKQADLALWFFPSLGEYTTLLEQQGFRVMLAQHYDRPTEMPSNDSGIIDWLSMFAVAFFEGIAEDEQALIKAEVQEKIKPLIFKDGKWYADYKRLRVLAVKE